MYKILFDKHVDQSEKIANQICILNKKMRNIL
jgi:hypothetical protein